MDAWLDKVPLPTPDVAAEVVDSEVLLYHPARTEALYLNVTSGMLWGLCDGTRTVRDIVALLQGGFPEAASQVPEDLEAALTELAGHGVLAFR